jgi:hypothetical protein
MSGDTGGLYLWITPAGGKLWRWKYRHEKEEKLMSFGKYPDVPLALARERHTEARKLLAKALTRWHNARLRRLRKRPQARIPFRASHSLWMEHWQDGKSPRHVDYVKRRMEADIFPAWARAPLRRLKRRSWWP